MNKEEKVRYRPTSSDKDWKVYRKDTGVKRMAITTNSTIEKGEEELISITDKWIYFIKNAGTLKQPQGLLLPL